MKLLVIEDSELIRKELINALKKLNLFFLYEADSGLKGLEVFHNEKPDIVILDLGLPYISGFEVLRKIKNSTIPAKTIIFTNHGEKYFTDICLKYGADYFFDKSLQFDELLNTVKLVKKELEHNGELQKE